MAGSRPRTTGTGETPALTVETYAATAPIMTKPDYRG